VNAGTRAVALALSWAATALAAGPDLAAQVADTERAFARSMAQRDLVAFAGFLSEQAVFFNGAEVLRGKAAVLAGWRPLFVAPQAPFAWTPDQVEVLADGQLAHSSGPVLGPDGKPVARFNSVWRQEAPGVWRIVFDKGSPLDRP
jgi:ketosteroid isomerase-like protein